MRKQSKTRTSSRIFTILLLCVTLLFSLLLFGCKPGKEESGTDFAFVNEHIWLDRYEEKIPELAEGDIQTLTFTSQNTEIVSVKDKKLIAEGVGETTVTASNGKQEVALTITVNDSGTTPRLFYETGKGAEAYLGVSVPMYISIRYNGEITLMEYTYDEVEIADGSKATFENGNIRGLALGKTTVNVSVNYKGLQLRLDNVELTVKQQSYVEFTEEEITLYNVRKGKLGKYELNAQAYYRGDLVEGSEISYSVSVGGDVVTIEEGFVRAIGVGEGTVLATYNGNGVTATKELKVKVLPNYIEEEFVSPTGDGSGTTAAYYQPYEGEIGGRTGVMEYHPGASLTMNSSGNYPDAFAHRVCQPKSAGTIIQVVRQGKEFFAFDVYYGSNSSTYIGCHTIVSWLNVNSYFRCDWFKILNEEGEVINYLPKNEWVTFVYDLRAFFDSGLHNPCGFWFMNTDKNNSCYLDNIRWYLDDAFMKSENLVYEDKGEYKQATNDEFDVFYPNQTAAPAYQAGGGAGRVSAYVYQTKAASAANSALVVATSLNRNYDQGFYWLRKKGASLSFDFYVESGKTLTLSMFYNSSSAKHKEAIIDLGGTDLAAYFGWLKIVKDGKVCSTVEKGNWYTAYIDYKKNYDKTCSSSRILFALAGNGDKAYIDNVRYWKTEPAFAETSYEKESNYPYASGGEITWDVSLREFDFAYYKVAATSDNNKLQFNAIRTPDGQTGSFFGGNDRYLKTKLYVKSGVSALKVGVSGGGLEAYEKILTVGQPLPTGVTLIDGDGRTARSLEEGEWYSLYIPVTVTGTVSAPDVYLTATGGTQTNPSILYLATTQCVSEENAPYLVNTGRGTELTYQKEGNFAGAYQFTSTSPGDDSGGNYGDGAVTFAGVTEVRDGTIYGGRFFHDGYKWVKTDLYLDESVKYLSIRSTDAKFNTAQGDVTSYWKQKIAVGSALASDVHLYVDGVKATKLQTGIWYSLYIPVTYSDADKVVYPYVCIYTSGNDKENPSSMYLKNIEYLMEKPNIPYLYLPTAAVGKATLHYLTEGEFAGAYEYATTVEGDAGSTAGDYGNKNGIRFSEVESGERSFFTDGKKWIKVEVYFVENITSVSVRITGDGITQNWKQKVSLDNTSSLWLYDAQGNSVTSAQKGVWYSLYLPVNYTNVETVLQGYSCIAVYLNGGTVAAPAKMYARNVEYLVEKSV